MLGYLLYGEDNYLLNRRINKLIDENILREWRDFNYIKLSENEKDIAAKFIAEIMTLPFGEGNKIVHIDGGCMIENLLISIGQELEKKLLQIPSCSILLITCKKKPDCRKSAVKTLIKLFQQEEFNFISSWDEQGIANLVRQYATIHKLKLMPDAFNYLAEAIGNKSACADSEFAKLAIYADGQTLTLENVKKLVSNTNTNYSKLISAIVKKDSCLAVEQVKKLIGNNEHPLKIVTLLTLSFRSYLITKVGIEANIVDSELAKIAEIKNIKKLYYLKNEVKFVEIDKLKKIVLTLAPLETELKSGTDSLISRIVEICNI